MQLFFCVCVLVAFVRVTYALFLSFPPSRHSRLPINFVVICDFCKMSCIHKRIRVGGAMQKLEIFSIFFEAEGATLPRMLLYKWWQILQGFHGNAILIKEILIQSFFPCCCYGFVIFEQEYLKCQKMVHYSTVSLENIWKCMKTGKMSKPCPILQKWREMRRSVENRKLFFLHVLTIFRRCLQNYFLYFHTKRNL